MEVKVNGRDYMAVLNLNNLDIFWNNLKEDLEREEKIIKEIFIDGTPVYEDFYEIIATNLPSIGKIEILTVSRRQACRELVQNLCAYLENLPPLLEDLANEFYLEPTKETWDNFQQFLEGVEWLVKGVNALAGNAEPTGRKELERRAGECKSLASRLLEAVSGKDYFQIGDLLHYDFVDQADSLRETLANIDDFSGINRGEQQCP